MTVWDTYHIQEPDFLGCFVCWALWGAKEIQSFAADV